MSRACWEEDILWTVRTCYREQERSRLTTKRRELKGVGGGGKVWRRVLVEGGCHLCGYIRQAMVTRVWPCGYVTASSTPALALALSTSPCQTRESTQRSRSVPDTSSVIPEADERDDEQALHRQAAPFAPYVPTAALPYVAFATLAATFILAFYSSTSVPNGPICIPQPLIYFFLHSLPKTGLPTRELGVTALASTLAGFGVVALFCSVGVYV